MSYTYDAAGDLLALKSSNVNGASDTYAYDVLNRLSTVIDASGQITYSYDNVGNLASFAYPNGVTTNYQYNPLNRLVQMGASKGSAAISSYAYTLGAAGNRLSVAELSGRTVNYGYDDLYRLTSETIAGATLQNGTISYVYDPVGNRKTMSSTAAAIPAGMFFYDSNDRLTTDNYDADGNTISSGGIVNHTCSCAVLGGADHSLTRRDPARRSVGAFPRAGFVARAFLGAGAADFVFEEEFIWPSYPRNAGGSFIVLPQQRARLSPSPTPRQDACTS